MNILLSYPYVSWHILFTFIPSILLWWYNWKYFLKYKKTFLLFIFLGIIFGPILDIVASPILHLWYFHPSNHFGPFILGLPLGEYLYIIFGPQQIVATVLFVRKTITKK